MRFVRLMLALVIALVAFAPATAQQEERYKITIELTLYGDVPQGETFFYAQDYPGRPGTRPWPFVFCGGDSGIECRGHGTVYRDSSLVFASALERWNKVQYIFGRNSQSSQPNYDNKDLGGLGYLPNIYPNMEIVHACIGDCQQVITGDTTFRAWYRFPEAHEDSMPKMPQTGAGGMAGR